MRRRRSQPRRRRRWRGRSQGRLGRPSRRPSASVAIADATVVATMAITHTAPTTRPIRRQARLPAASPSPPRRAPRPITTPSATGRSRVAPTPHRTARRIGSRCMLPLFVPQSGRPRRRFPRLSSGAQGRVKKASAAVPAARWRCFPIGGGGDEYDGPYRIPAVRASGSVDHAPFVPAEQARNRHRLHRCRRCGVHRKPLAGGSRGGRARAFARSHPVAGRTL